MASNGSCFYGRLNCFQEPPLGGRSNTKMGDNGTEHLTTVDDLFLFLSYARMCVNRILSK